MPFSFFGRRKAPDGAARSTVASQTAPGTEIQYSPDLIERFKDHHGALKNLIGRIGDSAGSGDFESTAKHLRKFKVLLNQHLLEENLRLYTYLKYCLKDNDEGSQLMRDMRQEMSAIGCKVTDFIRHYEAHGVDERNVGKFLVELLEITEALNDRVQREESSLYTLYLPPSHIGL